ncbi:MAG: hypothetical protein SOU51_03215 [Collinsella sp.]|nr:hypothetical protein [Collinsella sp.]
MKKVLVASHGHLASGVKSVAKILLHDDSAVTAIDCYVDESDPREKIQGFIDSIGPDDDAIIFTDLMGGSVCNTVTAMRPETKGIVHVTGFNLAVILECLVSSEAFTPEFVDEVIAAGSGLMRRVEMDEGVLPQDSEEEADDFFA